MTTYFVRTAVTAVVIVLSILWSPANARPNLEDFDKPFNIHEDTIVETRLLPKVDCRPNLLDVCLCNVRDCTVPSCPFIVWRKDGYNDFYIYYEGVANGGKLSFKTNPTYFLTISCRDRAGNTAERVAEIDVQQNQAPQITNPDATLTLDVLDTNQKDPIFTVTATDPEDDPLFYSMTTNPKVNYFTIGARDGMIDRSVDLRTATEENIVITVSVTDGVNVAKNYEIVTTIKIDLQFLASPTTIKGYLTRDLRLTCQTPSAAEMNASHIISLVISRINKESMTEPPTASSEELMTMNTPVWKGLTRTTPRPKTTTTTTTPRTTPTTTRSTPTYTTTPPTTQTAQSTLTTWTTPSPEDLIQIAEVTAFGELEAKDPDIAAITGNVTNGVQYTSYLQVTIDHPGGDKAGEYVCEVNVLDKNGHTKIFFKALSILTSDVSPNDVGMQLGDLTSQLDARRVELQKRRDDLEQRVHDLEMEKIQLKRDALRLNSTLSDLIDQREALMQTLGDQTRQLNSILSQI